MNPFYDETDDQIRAKLLHQDHEDFDAFATAVRENSYAIVQVTAPSGLGATSDRLSWLHYNSGRATITWSDGEYTYRHTIHIDVSRPFYDTIRLMSGEAVAIAPGELMAQWHAPTHGIVAMQVPERILAVVMDLLANNKRSYENAEEVARIHAEDRRRAEMEYEAEHDPEGAFGGRGNNFPIR